jgi:hypothetical protein
MDRLALRDVWAVRHRIPPLGVGDRACLIRGGRELELRSSPSWSEIVRNMRIQRRLAFPFRAVEGNSVTGGSRRTRFRCFIQVQERPEAGLPVGR